MDVAHDHEATFNEVYDKEHVPNLRAVPGVRRASRYKQPSATEPRYIAAYEVDGPADRAAAFRRVSVGKTYRTATREETSRASPRHAVAAGLVSSLQGSASQGIPCAA
jgi:hypothetical protein